MAVRLPQKTHTVRWHSTKLVCRSRVGQVATRLQPFQADTRTNLPRSVTSANLPGFHLSVSLNPTSARGDRRYHCFGQPFSCARLTQSFSSSSRRRNWMSCPSSSPLPFPHPPSADGLYSQTRRSHGDTLTNPLAQYMALNVMITENLPTE